MWTYVICEFIGLDIQSKLENILPKTSTGWYQDDESILLRNLNGKQIDKKRKNIIKISKDKTLVVIQTNPAFHQLIVEPSTTNHHSVTKFDLWKTIKILLK